MNDPVFEAVYREKLWRLFISQYKGEKRLAFWSHYKDGKTGEWKPCGGNREAPGVIVPADRQPELEAAIKAIGAELRSDA